MNEIEKRMRQIIKDQWNFLYQNQHCLVTLFDFAAKLKPYSARNILLAMYQRNGCLRQIAGSDEWTKMGRRLLPNQRAIKIFAPEESNDNNKVTRFLVVNVYDVDQTYGANLPNFLPPLNFYKNIIGVMAKNKFKITISSNNNVNLGKINFSTNTIQVNPKLSELEKGSFVLKAFAIFLLKEGYRKGYFSFNNTMVTPLADSISYIINKRLNLNTNEINSSELLFNSGELEKNLKIVFRIAYKIIDYFEGYSKQLLEKKIG